MDAEKSIGRTSLGYMPSVWYLQRQGICVFMSDHLHQGCQLIDTVLATSHDQALQVSRDGREKPTTPTSGNT